VVFPRCSRSAHGRRAFSIAQLTWRPGTLSQTVCATYRCPLTVSVTNSKYFCSKIRPCVFSALERYFADALHKSTFYLLTYFAYYFSLHKKASEKTLKSPSLSTIVRRLICCSCSSISWSSSRFWWHRSMASSRGIGATTGSWRTVDRSGMLPRSERPLRRFRFPGCTLKQHCTTVFRLFPLLNTFSRWLRLKTVYTPIF